MVTQEKANPSLKVGDPVMEHVPAFLLEKMKAAEPVNPCRIPQTPGQVKMYLPDKAGVPGQAAPRDKAAAMVQVRALERTMALV